jgi:hypothetical protein
MPDDPTRNSEYKEQRHFGQVLNPSRHGPHIEGDRSIPRCGTRDSRRYRVIVKRKDRADTMIGVAIGIAVGESCGDLAQIGGAD